MGIETVLAIAGTAAGVAGSAMTADATKDVAAGSAAASQQSIALQKEATQRAYDVLTPYSQRGNRANAYMDAFLYGDGDVSGGTLTGTPTASAAQTTSGITLESILREQHPTAAAQWDKWEANLKPSSYTKGHRAVYGDFEGFVRKGDPTAIQRAQTTLNERKAEAVKASQPAQATGGEEKGAREVAQDAYEQSPWAREAKDYETAIFGKDGVTSFDNSPWKGMTDRATERAQGEFMNDAGANGMALSGRTARGLQENAANINDAFFKDYSGAVGDVTNMNTGSFSNFWNALAGQSNTGYSADTGIVSAGQNFANNAGASLENQAQVSGQAGISAANSNVDALNNGLSWAGWLYGKKNPVGGTSSTHTVGGR